MIVSSVRDEGADMKSSRTCALREEGAEKGDRANEAGLGGRGERTVVVVTAAARAGRGRRIGRRGGGGLVEHRNTTLKTAGEVVLG